MAEMDSSPVQVSPDGIKGLAMMVPIVGLPLLPILGGVALAGIGYLAFSGLYGQSAPGLADIFKSLGIPLPDTCNAAAAVQMPSERSASVESDAARASEVSA